MKGQRSKVFSFVKDQELKRRSGAAKGYRFTKSLKQVRLCCERPRDFLKAGGSGSSCVIAPLYIRYPAVVVSAGFYVAMLELVDKADLKSAAGNSIRVRLPVAAPNHNSQEWREVYGFTMGNYYRSDSARSEIA